MTALIRNLECEHMLHTASRMPLFAQAGGAEAQSTTHCLLPLLNLHCHAPRGCGADRQGSLHSTMPAMPQCYRYALYASLTLARQIGHASIFSLHLLHSRWPHGTSSVSRGCSRQIGQSTSTDTNDDTRAEQSCVSERAFGSAFGSIRATGSCWPSRQAAS